MTNLSKFTQYHWCWDDHPERR